MNMSRLLAPSLGLYLRYLFGEPEAEAQRICQAVLAKSVVAPLYLAPLRDVMPILCQAESPSEAVTQRAERERSSDRHDDFRRAVSFGCQAVLAAPDTTPERAAAARAVKATYGMCKKDGYLEAAAQATTYRAGLTTLSESLELAGPDFGRWALGMTESAEDLTRSLAAQSTSRQRERLSEARHTAIRTLRRLREALAEEQAQRPELPANIDVLVFSYLEEISARQSRPVKPTQPSTPNE